MVINRIKDRNMGHQVPHWDLGDLHGSLWGFQEEIWVHFFTVIPLKSLCAQITCYLTSWIQYSLCFLYFGKQGFSEKGNPETKPGGMVQ